MHVLHTNIAIESSLHGTRQIVCHALAHTHTHEKMTSLSIKNMMMRFIPIKSTVLSFKKRTAIFAMQNNYANNGATLKTETRCHALELFETAHKINNQPKQKQLESN